MDGNLNDNASLRARIKELERGMITRCSLLVIVFVILVFECVFKIRLD